MLRLLEEYLRELEQGRLPDREQILATHPDLVEPLRPYLATLEDLHSAAANLRDPSADRQPEEGQGANAIPGGGRLGDFGRFRGASSLMDWIVAGSWGWGDGLPPAWKGGTQRRSVHSRCIIVPDIGTIARCLILRK